MWFYYLFWGKMIKTISIFSISSFRNLHFLAISFPYLVVSSRAPQKLVDYSDGRKFPKFCKRWFFSIQRIMEYNHHQVRLFYGTSIFLRIYWRCNFNCSANNNYFYFFSLFYLVTSFQTRKTSFINSWTKVSSAI